MEAKTVLHPFIVIFCEIPASLLLAYVEVEVEVEVKLRPKVSRPVRLGVSHPSLTGDQFFFLFEVFLR
jgi:hypothetical protein